MKDTKEKIVNDLYHIVMTLNDPEFGLDATKARTQKISQKVI